MPNWTTNKLTITGPAEDLAILNQIITADNGKLSLKHFIPTPDALTKICTGFHKDADGKEVREWYESKDAEGKPVQTPVTQQEHDDFKVKYGATNWYDWNLANWGTKWDIDGNNQQCCMTNEKILINFLSAWDTPTIGLLEISKRFPTLEFDLVFKHEGGFGSGWMQIQNGKEI